MCEEKDLVSYRARVQYLAILVSAINLISGAESLPRM